MWAGFAVDDQGHRVVIRPPKSEMLLGGLVLLVFGVGLVVFPYALSRGGLDVFSWVCVGLGGFALIGSVIAITYRAEVSWEPHGQSLTLCRGQWPFISVVVLGKSRLQAEISMADGGGAFSHLQRGCTVLSLTYSGRPGRVRLVSAASHSDLKEVVRRLAAFLGSAVQDRTRVSMQLEDGTSIEVDT